MYARVCMCVLTDHSPHIIYTLSSFRDTELAQLPVGLLNTLKLKQPQVVGRMIDILGEKILGGYTRLSSHQPSE